MTREGTLRIEGDVEGVSKLELRDESSTATALRILKSDTKSIEAGALAAFSLVPGRLYGLVVTSAEAADVIPIRIESEGPRGAAGPEGAKGPKGDLGPVGPPGRGASIVVKDGERTVAYFLSAVDALSGWDNVNPQALLLLAASGQIVQVDLQTGKYIDTGTGLFYTGADCTGDVYSDYRITTQFPVLGRVFRPRAVDQYYEITGFVDFVTVASSRTSTSLPLPGCLNGVSNLRAGAGSGVKNKVATLRPIPPPESLERLAPIKLQLE